MNTLKIGTKDFKILTNLVTLRVLIPLEEKIKIEDGKGQPLAFR